MEPPPRRLASPRCTPTPLRRPPRRVPERHASRPAPRRHRAGGTRRRTRRPRRRRGRHRRPEADDVRRPALRRAGDLPCARAGPVGRHDAPRPARRARRVARRRAAHRRPAAHLLRALAQRAPPAAVAVALQVRVPPLPRALPVGRHLRRLERGEPLRRADVPSAEARRRLLEVARAGVPELHDPRLRAARHAQHGQLGPRVPALRRHASRRCGVCTTTSTSTGSARAGPGDCCAR